jgi:hypothetical protein
MRLWTVAAASKTHTLVRKTGNGAAFGGEGSCRLAIMENYG